MGICKGREIKHYVLALRRVVKKEVICSCFYNSVLQLTTGSGGRSEAAEKWKGCLHFMDQCLLIG